MGRFLAFLHRRRRALIIGAIVLLVAAAVWIIVPPIYHFVRTNPLGALYVLGILSAIVGLVTASTEKDASIGASFTTIALLAFAAAAMIAPVLLS